MIMAVAALLVPAAYDTDADIDDAEADGEEGQSAGRAARRRRRGVGDWYAFTLSFKGVLLEGLEVVFIAVTFGASQKNVGLAAAGAAAAVAVVAAAGVAVRAPLARGPENPMKFAVGVMLTSFGMFWGAEGAGVAWPGGDAALLAIVPLVLATGAGYTAALRRSRAAAGRPVPGLLSAISQLPSEEREPA
jgi:uncharacterized membrane protein